MQLCNQSTTSSSHSCVINTCLWCILLLCVNACRKCACRAWLGCDGRPIAEWRKRTVWHCDRARSVRMCAVCCCVVSSSRACMPSGAAYARDDASRSKRRAQADSRGKGIALCNSRVRGQAAAAVQTAPRVELSEGALDADRSPGTASAQSGMRTAREEKVTEINSDQRETTAEHKQNQQKRSERNGKERERNAGYRGHSSAAESRTQ